MKRLLDIDKMLLLFKTLCICFATKENQNKRDLMKTGMSPDSYEPAIIFAVFNENKYIVYNVIINKKNPCTKICYLFLKTFLIFY